VGRSNSAGADNGGLMSVDCLVDHRS